MPYLSRKKKRRGEDVVGLAGWLFTDLLLGISLIFLATTSFQVFGNKEGAPCANREKTYFSTPMIKEYKNAYDAESKIVNDISSFALTSKLDKPSVAVGLIWGNYSASEGAQRGQDRAWNFYKTGLRKADGKNFPELKGYKSDDSENMRFLGEASSRRSLESVKVELYFIYDQCKVVGVTSTNP